MYVFSFQHTQHNHFASPVISPASNSFTCKIVLYFIVHPLSFWRKICYFYFMCMYFACMYAYMYTHTYAGMYTICVSCAIGGQKKMMSYALELELCIVMNHHVGARNGTWVFCGGSQGSQPLSHWIWVIRGGGAYPFLFLSCVVVYGHFKLS